MGIKAGGLIEGRYRILKTLGEGGMGTVYLAEHVLIRRRVALKILHDELATDEDVIERFMNEARAAGTLGHPNIVESTDMGFTHAHVPYIVFEYLEGTLLTDEIYRVRGLPVRRAVRIAQQIASALQAAHNAGIVHRDLKSDNIFLTDKEDALDHVKVLDFGISRFLDREDKQTRRGMVMGTPEFMAPEQITDPQSVDRRADVYALGVIMYEMLAARRPFPNDEDPRALLHRIVNEDPPPLERPEVPRALVEMIFGRMLAKSPGDRFQTMLDVEAALEAFSTRSDARIEDVARRSDLIPRPVKSLDDTTLAVVAVSTTTGAPVKARPWALYGIAGAGVVVGAIGLAMGMRGSSTEQPVATAAPPPAAVQAPVTREAKVTLAVQANVASARVVFRRRSSAAPLAIELGASEIVELVEVSAAGHKTMRYWITVDRATHLTAQLVPGDGLVEATEEQTLIALGEMAAPVRPAAVETKQAVTVQPKRKIGKAAVATPKVERVVVEAPIVGPDPAPQPTPALDKIIENPIKPVEEVAVEKPAPPKPSVDVATLNALVAKHRPAVLGCFAEGKKAIKGTLTLQLQIDAKGAVKRVQVSSTIAGAAVASACVVKSAYGWKFPASGVPLSTVSYPFAINLR